MSAAPPALLARLAPLRRASWNLVDQVLSALSNVLLSFAVARSVDARGFGTFAVAFLLFSVLIGVERALAGQPLSIRFSGARDTRVDQAVSAALGTTVVVAVSAAVITVVTGVLVGGLLGPTLVAFGVCLPGLLLQDACRMALFARSRADHAAANDALWAVLQFAVIGALVVAQRNAVWMYVLAWGGSALLCAAVGLGQLGVVPGLDRVPSWVREQRDLSGYLLAEFLLGAGAVQGGILGIGGLVGVGDIGALRAAQVLLGPLLIVSTAANTFLLPEISNRPEMTAPARRRLALLVTGAQVLIALSYTSVLLLVPDSIGTALLGDTWSGASTVLLPMALGSAAAGATLGPAVMIYAMGLARLTFRLHVFEAPLTVGCIIVGGLLGSTRGAAWGLATSILIMIPLWFLQLSSVLRSRVQE